MCGIHGYLQLDGGPVPEAALLSRMGRVTSHRGPDDEGQIIDRELLLGMRRLSIIDVAGGHQPIANEDQDVWVVCNGEIYNFRELRATLAACGHRFRTSSDTEVLVHAYEEYGDDFVGRLDGMFGFALWDARRRRLLIGRDALGIKPVYYRLDARRLIFASEAKAILEAPGLQPELDMQALDQYLALGYVPAPRSLFAGISKLPVASMLIAEHGKVRIQRYWELPRELDAKRGEDQWAEELRAHLERAVHAQMVSDVPLGAFLSGGIDSSAVVAFMSRHSERPVKTYSIGFAGSSGAQLYNELPAARQVSQLFRTEHREIIVNPDVISLLPRLIWHLDEPMADAAFITTYLVSEFARRDVTVILSGVGGDELFGGYNRYLDEHYRAKYAQLPRWLRHGIVEPLARRLPADRHSKLLNVARLARRFVLAQGLALPERYGSYMSVFGASQRRGLRPQGGTATDAVVAAFNGAPADDFLQTLMHVDLGTQLPDDLLLLTDKMSMATSLECRVPLLDRQLVEFAARMPAAMKIRGRRLKHVMKRALGGVLPDSVLYRPKRGFGAPIGAWMKHELRPMIDGMLSKEAVERRGLFAWPSVEQTLRQHFENREDHTDHLLALLNLELWCRTFLDRHSTADLGAELVARASA